jgi:hypothetical protein
VRREPGTVLRYRLSSDDPVVDVGPDDPVWQPGYRLQSSVHFGFRAFSLDGKASSLERRSYQIRTMGMFLQTELLPVRTAEEADLRVLPPGWYYFKVTEPSSLTLVWDDPAILDFPTVVGQVDGDSSDTFAVLPVLISVFEPDLCTPVPDAEGVRVVQGLDPSVSPVRLWLPAGTFYLQVQAPESDPAHPGILAALVRDGD